MKPNVLWYAEGLRWIGSLFNGAAEHLERSADTEPFPRRCTVDEYVSDVRHRVYIHF